jgi:hypothetical protein
MPFIFFIVIGVIVSVVVAQITKRNKEIITHLESGGEIRLKDNSANYFGRDSLKKNQPRGNGVLAIFNETLYFELYVPRKSIEIPLSMITGVERGTSFLGKTKMTPLLIVHFLNEFGQDETAAWQVKNLPAWEKTLNQTLSKGRRSL